MTNITLKLATEKDILTYIALEKSVVNLKVYSANIDEEEAKEEFKNNIVYLIYKDDVVVGSIGYEIKNPEHAYISGLVIKPEFQGKGIGREALKQVLEKIKNIKRIDLVTHPDNISALKLYKSFGFVVESRKENYYGDGEPRVIMSRTI